MGETGVVNKAISRRPQWWSTGLATGLAESPGNAQTPENGTMDQLRPLPKNSLCQVWMEVWMAESLGVRKTASSEPASSQRFTTNGVVWSVLSAVTH